MNQLSLTPIDRHFARVNSLYGRGQLSPVDSNEANLVVIGCVKSKLTTDNRVAAKDLYTSELFLKRRAYAEATGKPWMILSAEHGLVHPDQMIPPYDADAARITPEHRNQLMFAVSRTLRAIELRPGSVIELHAGSDYAEILIDNPYLHGDFEIRLPMRGKQIGEQLAEYLQATKTADGKSRRFASKRARMTRLNDASRHGAYDGAPIVATKVFRRPMPQFRTCKAESWVLINERTGMVIFANTYNGVLKNTYDPRHYTHPYKAALHDLRTSPANAVAARDWPKWIVEDPSAPILCR